MSWRYQDFALRGAYFFQGVSGKSNQYVVIYPAFRKFILFYKTTGYIKKVNRERSGPESWPVPGFNTPIHVHTRRYQLC